MAPCLDAASECSDRAVRAVAQAIELFDRKEFLSSTDDLCYIVEVEPECAEALWVQSFINWCSKSQGTTRPYKLTKEEMKRRALEINPKLGQSWEQTGKDELEGLRTETFEHFEIRYFRSEDRTLAWDTNRYLAEIYNEIQNAFGSSPTKRFQVVLYTPETILSSWRTVAQGGFFNTGDGTLRLRVSDANASGDLGLRYLARREYARAYLSKLGLRGIPGWFREGSADFYAARSSDGFWKDNRLEQTRKYFRGFSPGPVANLKSMETQYFNKRIQMTVGKYHAYLLAEAMVLTIAKDRGDSWIPSVIQRMQAGASWDEAYQTVVGVSPEETLSRFHKSWKPAGGF